MKACGVLIGRTLAFAALLGTLAGCGREAQIPAEAAQWGECDRDAFARADGRVARLVPDGMKDPIVVKLVDGTGPCGGGLVARSDGGVQGTDTSDLDLDAGSAKVVPLRDGQLLLRIDSAGHPRGGYQPHLFSVTQRVSELRVDGAPVLPFVATDGGAAPTAARCGRDGTLELLRATTSEPPGVVLAWDVYRTTYQVDVNRVTELSSAQIRDHAADPLLHEQMPWLFEQGDLLGNCD